MSHRDAPDDPDLSHQVHEGVLHSHQDVCGHPVTAALLDVGTRGVRVIASRRGRSRRHGTVTYRARAGTGLQGTTGDQVSVLGGQYLHIQK